LPPLLFFAIRGLLCPTGWTDCNTGRGMFIRLALVRR
jgi:hypothetical protein